jgi:hypothetical protein
MSIKSGCSGCLKAIFTLFGSLLSILLIFTVFTSVVDTFNKTEELSSELDYFFNIIVSNIKSETKMK